MCPSTGLGAREPDAPPLARRGGHRDPYIPRSQNIGARRGVLNRQREDKADEMHRHLAMSVLCHGLLRSEGLRFFLEGDSGYVLHPVNHSDAMVLTRGRVESASI
jgi:hypothetical protein